MLLAPPKQHFLFSLSALLILRSICSLTGVLVQARSHLMMALCTMGCSRMKRGMAKVRSEWRREGTRGGWAGPGGYRKRAWVEAGMLPGCLGRGLRA